MELKNLSFYSKGLIDDKYLVIKASTKSVDRHGEIVLPESYINFKDTYMRNPVVLQYHNYWDEPVGKVVELTNDEESIVAKIEFAPTEVGEKFKQLYKGGFMNAFSIGFIAKQFVKVDSSNANSLSEKYKIQDMANLTKIYTEIELLEVSCVPVPANRDAVVLSAKSFCYNNPEELESVLQELKGLKGDSEKTIEEKQDNPEDDIEEKQDNPEDDLEQKDTQNLLEELSDKLVEKLSSSLVEKLTNTFEDAVSDLTGEFESTVEYFEEKVNKEISALRKAFVTAKSNGDEDGNEKVLNQILCELSVLKK